MLSCAISALSIVAVVHPLHSTSTRIAMKLTVTVITTDTVTAIRITEMCTAIGDGRHLCPLCRCRCRCRFSSLQDSRRARGREGRKGPVTDSSRQHTGTPSHRIPSHRPGTCTRSHGCTDNESSPVSPSSSFFPHDSAQRSLPFFPVVIVAALLFIRRPCMDLLLQLWHERPIRNAQLVRSTLGPHRGRQPHTPQAALRKPRAPSTGTVRLVPCLTTTDRLPLATSSPIAIPLPGRILLFEHSAARSTLCAALRQPKEPAPYLRL